MVASYLQSDHISVDCTFNILAAECVMFTMACITPNGSALPVLVGLVRSENAVSIGHVLEQFHNLVREAGFSELPTIRRVTQDGSPALHAAIQSFYPSATITSCFFHFMQMAKKKKPTTMEAAVWNEVKADLRTVGLASSAAEHKVLLQLLSSKWEARPEHGVTDLLKKLEEGGWLNLDNFRCRWTSHHTGGTGGRTSNALECFHKFLKEKLLKNHRMQTLFQFSHTLTGPGWRAVSNYNKDKSLRRYVTKEDRLEAAGIDSCSPLPRSLSTRVTTTCRRPGCNMRPCSRSSHYREEKVHTYIFTEEASESNEEAESDLTARITLNYSSFDQARRITHNVILVTYLLTPDVRTLPKDGGPRCTCSKYARRAKCKHLVALGHLLGVDDKQAWDIVKARLERKKARVCHGLNLPQRPRYGLPRKRPTPSETSRILHSMVRGRGLDDFPWPPHHRPDEEERKNLKKRDISGCCQGTFDSDSVYCSSRRCSHNWWHLDCVEAWCRETNYPTPDMNNPKAPWYCPRCRLPQSSDPTSSSKRPRRNSDQKHD